MKTKKSTFQILTKKNVIATSVVALAGISVATGTAALNNQPEIKLGDLNNANVTICHKGRDIQVAVPSLAGHLGHGDSIGSCDDDPGGGGRGL